MQAEFNIINFKKIGREKQLIARETLAGFSYEQNSFVLFATERFKGVTSGFDVNAYFLYHIVDAQVNNVFIFSLEKRGSMETYISWFYLEPDPSLFAWFDERRSAGGFCFPVNRFEHEAVVPAYPQHLDKISAMLYYEDSDVLSYRIFDASMTQDIWAKRILYFKYFLVRRGLSTRFVRRNRFYKRKFNYFSKFY